MKRERSGIGLLLGLLLVLSTFIGALHAQQAATGISAEKFIDFIQPLIISESVESIVEAMRTASPDAQRKVLFNLIQNQTMKNSDIIQILFGLALYQHSTPKTQNSLLSLITEQPVLEMGIPLFFIAAKSSYPSLLPDLKRWMQRRPNGTKKTAQAVQNAQFHAVQKNDVHALQTMEKQGIIPTQEVATQLLFEAAPLDKDGSLVSYLLKFSPDVNYARGGVTPLIKATQAGNMPAVQALVKEAKQLDINKIADPTVGNALEIVLEQTYNADAQKDIEKTKKFVEIEVFLRKYGAREDISTSDQKA